MFFYMLDVSICYISLRIALVTHELSTISNTYLILKTATLTSPCHEQYDNVLSKFRMYCLIDENKFLFFWVVFKWLKNDIT